MSTKGEVLFHPGNRSQEQTWQGFSWPAFFFGPIWLLIKGLWGHALIYVIVALGTWGVGAFVLWFVYGFKGNDLHKSLLLRSGYLTSSQLEAPAKDVAPPAAGSAVDPIQRLKDLADLRDRGVLTDAEFQAHKAKLVV